MSLPVFFVERMRQSLGVEADLFFNALETEPPVSLRLNPFKPHDLFTQSAAVPWSDSGKYLEKRISFTLDPLFHAGCYYVQEASSMYVEQAIKAIVRDAMPIRVLDLCAAPGGKSTHLLSLLPTGSLLVCNEVISSRNKVLQYNISKWGLSNVVVTQNAADDFSRLNSYFDLILVDAPCSGEGLFRKDPDAMCEWSTDAAAMCSVRQREILDGVLPALKPGGFLLYSTCTYNPDENDRVIAYLLAHHNFNIVALPEFEGAVKSNYGIQMYPHLIRGEGFFISLLQKPDDDNRPADHRFRDTSKDVGKLQTWILNHGSFRMLNSGQQQFLVPSNLIREVSLIQQNMFVRKAGVCAGSLTGDVFVPSHELALSVDRSSGIPVVRLERDEAVAYLRGETMGLPVVHQGWHLATFEGHALGWLKGIGRRVNNYYPKEYRILKRD